MFKNFIWDFDGTLFNTYPAIIKTYCEALKKLNIKENQQTIEHYLRKSTSIKLLEYLQTKYNLDIEKYMEFVNDYENNYCDNSRSPFPHIKQTCKLIMKRNGINYIFTNSKYSYVYLLLQYHNMVDMFEDIQTVENGFNRKPAPGGIIYLINKHNLVKETTIYVGDREIDIEAAHNAGIKCCYFDTNNNPIISDYNVKKASEILKLIEKNKGRRLLK